jgi:hypothetical protein
MFYIEGDMLMAVKLTTSPVFERVSTTLLFSDPHLAAFNATNDVSSDARFVMLEDAESEETRLPKIHVVENWYEEFRGRE